MPELDYEAIGLSDEQQYAIHQQSYAASEPTINDQFPKFKSVRILDQETGYLIEHKKGIKRVSLNPDEPVMDIVGEGYKLIQHEDLYNTYYSALNEKIPHEYWHNVEISKRFSPNGALMFALFKFPNLFTEYTLSNWRDDLPSRSVRRTFHVFLKNSVDGSSSASAGVGLMDFFCENFEMGGEWELFRRRHTSGFRLDDFVSPQSNYISSFEQMRLKHDHQINTSCDDVAVIKYLEHNPSWTRKVVDDDGRSLEHADGTPVIELNRPGNKLFEQWRHESQMRGNNLFALSSALTFWSCHDSDNFAVRRSNGVKNTLKVLLDRQSTVQRLLQKAPFAKEKVEV